MKSRALKMGATVLLALAFGIIVWDAQRPTEPTYEGKPLTFWLKQYDLNSNSDAVNPAEDQASNAVRSIGTKGIPTLLKLIRKRESMIQKALRSLPGPPHVSDVYFDALLEQDHETLLGFKILGPAAKGAVPELILIFEREKGHPQLAAAQALRVIGPAATPAIPSLLRAATNSDPMIRFNALFAMDGIHSSNDLVLPALIASMNDPDFDIRSLAIASLVKYDTIATVCALAQATTNADSGLRGAVCTALGDTHAAPELATRALRERLHDPAPAVRANAAAALNRIEPASNPKPADK